MSFDDLYTDRILKLAANMPGAGRLADAHGSAEKTAKLCGSRVAVDVKLEHGRIVGFAQEVQACALGQASAAILGANVVGATVEEVEAARAALVAMLRRGGPPPEGRFGDLAVLQGVKDYPARHASTALAFEAAVVAIAQALGRRGADAA